MTVINQNSISGITSITAASGSVQIFNSDGSSGSLTDLAGVNVAGVVTATSYSGTSSTIKFETGGSERARIDSSGRLGIGIDAPGSFSSGAANLVVSATSGNNSGITVNNEGADLGSIFFANGTSQTGQGRIRYDHSADSLSITTNGNSSGGIFVDSSQRVGIGTNSVSSKLHVLNPSGGSSTTEVSTIERDNSGYFIKLYRNAGSGNAGGLIGADSAGAYFAGGHSTNNQLYIDAGNAVMQFYTNSAERARIDSSGRLLVGTTTSALEKVVIKGDGGGLQINRNDSGSPTSGQALGSIGFKGIVSANTNAAAEVLIQAAADENHSGSTAGSRLEFHTKPNGTGPGSSPTERMRIGQNGSVQIGRTVGQIETELLTLQNSGQCVWIYQTANSNVEAITIRHTYAQSAQTAKMIRFSQNNGTEVGSITSTTTATAYGTSSDYRLKENVAAVTDGIGRLQQLKPSRFNFIIDPDKTVDGFIAHEVQAVVPEAIIGEKDAEDEDGNPIYQSIDQSKLVPLLTAALQELVSEVESLKAEVAALKAQ